MRDLKTYLSVAPVLSTLWFGSLAGLLIEINRLFPARFRYTLNISPMAMVTTTLFFFFFFFFSFFSL
jgi:photosystem I subunit 9